MDSRDNMIDLHADDDDVDSDEELPELTDSDDSDLSGTAEVPIYDLVRKVN